MTPAMLTAIGRTLAATEYFREEDNSARLYLGYRWPLYSSHPDRPRWG